ncbi:uncharacterized protein LOC133728173 isoform X1 [Rosa rugosa]|uniref:uncharacterized protein LOC133708095 isoform X1 n=2 Tax=Rosa rugosa TaxID=74645 RepID=UPI002B406D9E|nr:uncharacterized protein LOC133708095 isoform X1 [Rosa rugosa]XP_061993022.1 uncharacterized protein LOC133710901 isoform X1 [Rosa rugosa]XP_062011568.1 uncharacterized protein LOC133728173 isoform X1 [Rosa rugosa]
MGSDCISILWIVRMDAVQPLFLHFLLFAVSFFSLFSVLLPSFSSFVFLLSPFCCLLLFPLFRFASLFFLFCFSPFSFCCLPFTFCCLPFPFPLYVFSTHINCFTITDATVKTCSKKLLLVVFIDFGCYCEILDMDRRQIMLLLLVEQDGEPRDNKMESGDENTEQGKSRRVWTSFEEESLLNVLDGIIAGGQRCDTGSFKSGTLIKIENALNLLCPNSNLKASPHIESKLKKLKKDYSIIYDMMNKSGFAWNDIKKCIEVDSNEVWETYLQHNKKAKGWRNKKYPLFDRLATIFGSDRATGNGAEVPADMMEEQSNNEDDIGIGNDTSPMSMRQDSTGQSQVSQKKRKRNDEDKIMLALDKLFEESGKRMQAVTDAIVKGNEDRSDIAKELKKMGLSVLDQIEALKIILDKPQNISVFMSLDDEVRKVYVENLLAGTARGST